MRSSHNQLPTSEVGLNYTYFFSLSCKDSNLKMLSQSQMCYRYTTRQCVIPFRFELKTQVSKTRNVAVTPEDNLARVEGVEPSSSVLETAMLPLSPYPCASTLLRFQRKEALQGLCGGNTWNRTTAQGFSDPCSTD